MDKFAPEVTRALHLQNFTLRTDPTARWATENEPGRADKVVTKNGKAAYVEIKDAYNFFPFAEWSEKQRDWAAKQVSPPNSTPYYIWLLIGENPPTYNPDKYKPRLAWLVPYHAWLAAEAQVVPYHTGFVYRAGKGTRKEVQSRKLDAVTLLHDYRLKWKSGNWHIPDSHEFSQYFKEPAWVAPVAS